MPQFLPWVTNEVAIVLDLCTDFRGIWVTDSFEFEDAGRTFSCMTEALSKARSDVWWWFRVSTDDRHRYAPFQASPDDTKTSVRTRIVAYYDDLLVRRAAPPANHWRRGGSKPEIPAKAPEAEANPAAEA